MSRSGARVGVGLGLLISLAALAVAAPWLAQDPYALDGERILAPPSTAHWLGTDQVGRDLLSRLLHGGRQSLTTGFVATLVGVGIAGLLGAAAGVAGRALDAALSRASDIVYAFPVLVGAIALLGSASGGALAAVPGALRNGLVIGLFAWPPLFRFVRAEARRWARSDLAAAGRAAGVPPARLALRHLLPAAAVPALVPASFLAAGSVLVEAGLGFLGLGVRPPRPSWGSLILDGMKNVEAAWWPVLFPGLFVFATVLAFHLLGEGLRRRLEA